MQRAADRSLARMMKLAAQPNEPADEVLAAPRLRDLAVTLIDLAEEPDESEKSRPDFLLAVDFAAN